MGGVGGSSQATALVVGPGQGAQFLHRDIAIWPFIEEAGLAAPQAMVSILLALSDFTEEVGATRVIPGHGPVGAGWPQSLADERRYFDNLTRDLRQLVKKGADMEQAAASAGQSERGNWALFDVYAPRNATAGFAEIEWE